MRTGLATFAAGFVIAKLADDFRPQWFAIAVGVALAAAGVAMLLGGYVSYRRVERKLSRKGVDGIAGWLVTAVVVAVVLSAAGAVVVLVGSTTGGP